MLPMPAKIAAASAAHRHGKLVFSHASNLAGLEVALGAHVDVLAHVLDDARGLTPQHFEHMKAQNVAIIPTLKLSGHPPYVSSSSTRCVTLLGLAGRSFSARTLVTWRTTIPRRSTSSWGALASNGETSSRA